ncbi:hypothetical protein, partial [Bacteroides ovatus]|uniref:hypothetical protein n=1 Tax=Bacteroides ovatus TaxID=28116 RepID=UPI00202E6DC3
EHIFMCYIYKDNQKSAYIQNIYWVYADYIRQLSYERTFSVPSKAGKIFSPNRNGSTLQNREEHVTTFAY